MGAGTGTGVLGELVAELDRIDVGPVDIRTAAEAPARTDIVVGGPVYQLDAAVLSTDIRQYSGMTNAFGRQTMVGMVRSFFAGATRIAADNGGKVADFNGDGMIVVFTGEDRVDKAARAAGQCKWFIDELLRPRFEAAFQGTQLVPADERLEMFDAGFAIDAGMILACGVGQHQKDDPVWVGACVNASAKLCKLARHPGSILITREAFDRMDFRPDDTFHGGWTPLPEPAKVGGVRREVLVTERHVPLR